MFKTPFSTERRQGGFGIQGRASTKTMARGFYSLLLFIILSFHRSKRCSRRTFCAALVFEPISLWDAQQGDVGWVVAESFHLGLSLGRLEGDEVVTVNACHIVPFLHAPLAHALSSPPHDLLGLQPTLVIEHPHVLRSVSCLAHYFVLYVRVSPLLPITSMWSISEVFKVGQILCCLLSFCLGATSWSRALW